MTIQEIADYLNAAEFENTNGNYAKSEEFIRDILSNHEIFKSSISEEELERTALRGRALSILTESLWQRSMVKEALPRTTTGKPDYPALRQEAMTVPSAAMISPS